MTTAILSASLEKLQAASTAAQAAQKQLTAPRLLKEKISQLEASLVSAESEEAARSTMAAIDSTKRDLAVAEALVARNEAQAVKAWKLVQTEAKATTTALEEVLEPLAGKYLTAVESILQTIHPRATEWSPAVAASGAAVSMLDHCRKNALFGPLFMRVANTHGAEIVPLVEEIEQMVASLPAAECEVTRITSIASKATRAATSAAKDTTGDASRELTADLH